MFMLLGKANHIPGLVNQENSYVYFKSTLMCDVVI